jgi:predicted short-subunit dehydrogenase-like oxidoreductase (DUF2520 family)
LLPDRIGIAGAGRVAQAFGKALQELGIGIEFLAGRNSEHARKAAAFIGPGTVPVSFRDLTSRASHVLIAVSDSAIEAVAGELAQQRGSIRVALHTSGSYGAELLEPLERLGVSCGTMHPLQTISNGRQGALALRGIAFAVSGAPGAAAWAEQITTALGGQILRVGPEARHVYHAAAVMASNYLAAIIDTAQELMAIAGIPREAALHALAPLARTSLENVFAYGRVEALTGPIVRGDAITVAAHTLALERADESAGQLYRAAGLRTLRMARERGLLPEQAAAVHRALTGED